MGATEELGVRVSVEGFQQFDAAFKKMDAEIGNTEKAYGGLATESGKAGKATDSLGQTFDTNAGKAKQLALAQSQLADVEKKLAGETDALKRAQLEVQADKLRGQIAALSTTTDDATQKTSKFKMGLADLKSGIDLAIGALNTIKAAAIGAFEFAQEGAAINATRESFDRLGVSLSKLQSASRGTIDDMTLMSGSLTLMAGSSGEVATAFSGALPQLLEMAKAANKLNPTLGDTNYMFTSIATAAKRQSTLIADNLGIVVKQESAYKKYADSIGVAVTALTAEQKQIAFLNDLLAAGNVLIEQAGGSTESAADSYAQLTVQVKNTTDMLKAQVADAVTPSVGAWANHYAALEAMGEPLISVGNWFDSVRLFVTGTSDATERYNDQLTRVAWSTATLDTVGLGWARTMETTTTNTNALALSTAESKDVFDQYTMALQQSDQALADYYNAQNEAKAGTLATTAEVDLFKAALGGAITNEMVAFRDRETDLVAKGEELRAKISELEQKKYLTEDQKTQLTELRTQLGENGKAINENAAKHEEATRRIMLGFVEQRLGMNGLTEEELLALQTMAKNWGLMDDATYDAIVSIDSYADSVDSGSSTLDKMVERVDKLNQNLLATPRDINVHFRIITEGEVPVGPGAHDAPYAFQHGGTTHGGTFLAGEHGPELISGIRGGARVTSTPYAMQHGGTTHGGTFMAGEHGPELITGVPGGARVMSAPATARAMSQTSITNNYNLTTNSQTRPGGLALEFATMEMGSR